MKVITLSLAAISGASFLFHNQLQSLVHQGTRGTPVAVQHQPATEGVYYLRTAYTFPVLGGMTRWAAGQELRTATNASAASGMVALTDGQNTAAVPETAVTQDVNVAAALRQLTASNQVAVPPLSADQLRDTALDTSAVRTNAVVGAPGYSTSYYHNTVIVERPTRVVVPRREIIVRERQPLPKHTSAPVVRTY